MVQISVETRNAWRNSVMLNTEIYSEVLGSDSTQSDFDPELDEAIRQQLTRDLKLENGYCNMADGITDFYIEPGQTNFRETIVSSISGSKNRERQLICALSYALFGGELIHSLSTIINYINDNNLVIYTAETTGNLFSVLQDGIRDDLFFCSEYFGAEYLPGSIVNGFHHEDLQNISFPDNTFDIVLTAEVLEHVPDALKAESEIVRVMKPKGVYCFTVPFMPNLDGDVIRAELDKDGNIVYLMEPEYHPAPFHPEGSLVYRVFSYKDLKTRFEMLRCKYTALHLWSAQYGIIGDFSHVHVVNKVQV